MSKPVIHRDSHIVIINFPTEAEAERFTLDENGRIEQINKLKTVKNIFRDNSAELEKKNARLEKENKDLEKENEELENKNEHLKRQLEDQIHEAGSWKLQFEDQCDANSRLRNLLFHKMDECALLRGEEPPNKENIY